MNGEVFLDTNILIYATGQDGRRTQTARDIVAQGGTISVQVINEFVNVSLRKLRWSWPDVRGALAALQEALSAPLDVDMRTHVKALAVCERHRFSFYDSLIVASALLARCKILLSEDMADGQVIEGLMIRNPFAARAWQ